MATEQVETAVGAHLVGGMKAPDAETAMSTAGAILGRHLYAVTDGETGERDQWIGWQLGKLTSVEGIDVVGVKETSAKDNPEYSGFPAVAGAPRGGASRRLTGLRAGCRVLDTALDDLSTFAHAGGLVALVPCSGS
jgi:hypothetical protein